MLIFERMLMVDEIYAGTTIRLSTGHVEGHIALDLGHGVSAEDELLSRFWS